MNKNIVLNAPLFFKSEWSSRGREDADGNVQAKQKCERHVVIVPGGSDDSFGNERSYKRRGLPDLFEKIASC